MWLTDIQKIGAALLGAGVLFFILGIFSLFDARLLSFGNVLFIVGLFVIVGVPRTIQYFTARRKRRGAVCFSIGLFMVFKHWAFTGFMIELFGILNLFADFTGVIVAFLRQIPFIGWMLDNPTVSRFADGLSNGNILPI